MQELLKRQAISTAIVCIFYYCFLVFFLEREAPWLSILSFAIFYFVFTVLMQILLNRLRQKNKP